MLWLDPPVVGVIVRNRLPIEVDCDSLSEVKLFIHFRDLHPTACLVRVAATDTDLHWTKATPIAAGYVVSTAPPSLCRSGHSC
jgi:hypothetical protein